MIKKSVFISGSTRGIGFALAEYYGANGFHVFINGRDPLHLESAAKLLKQHGYSITALLGDVGNPTTVTEIASAVHKEVSALDVLILNAGQSYTGLLNDMTTTQWDMLFQTNVSSLFYLTKSFTPPMIQKQRGALVVISSIWGQVGASCEVAYSATKGAADAFTKSLSKELGPSNIRVNGIACGWIETSMTAHYTDEDRLAFEEQVPLGRLGVPADIAPFCFALTENISAYCTGQIITIDGGYL